LNAAGSVAAESAVGDRQRPAVGDAAPVIDRGVAAEGGVNNGERPTVVDAATVPMGNAIVRAKSRVVANCTAGYRQRSVVDDAAASVARGVAVDRAIGDCQRPAAIDAAAVTERELETPMVTSGIVAYGAVGDRYVDSCTVTVDAATSAIAEASVFSGKVVIHTAVHKRQGYSAGIVGVVVNAAAVSSG
jgi:hypothetical protein